MSFIWPALLWSLLTIPLLGWLYLQMQEKRSQFALRYGSLGLVQQAGGRGIGSRRHIPAVLFLGGLSVLLLAMARPQMPVSLPKAEGTVILAFDVSGSMAADDFKPTRLEAAKKVAREFVERQPSTVQIGIVVFSDSGFLAQSPTNDQAAILSAIDRLHIQSGTSLGSALADSLITIAVAEAIANGRNPMQGVSDSFLDDGPPLPIEKDSAVIVLLTDGENNMDPDPFVIAQVAARSGVKIHAIGIGSTAGTELEVNGFTVFTQLDEATLRQISDMTEGHYYNALTEQDLDTIYENIEPRLKIEKEQTEVTAILAGLSILILLTGGMLSLFWFSHVP